AIREQIASAIDVILQVSRMTDGRRVITAVTEVQGMEGDTILLQDIFKYRSVPGEGEAAPGGELVATGLRPKFVDKLAEASIAVPAAAFKAPAGTAPGRATTATQVRGRKVRVPTPRDIAERERLR
ncbi:MAG TPA: hypothetical protein VIR58_06150, partial [Acidimicrobiales bacterium]